MKNLFDKYRKYVTWHRLVLIALVWIGYELHTINTWMPTDGSIGYEIRPLLRELEEVNRNIAEVSIELKDIAFQLKWGRR